MSYLQLFYPFGRVRRLLYFVTVLACLAIGWAGLNVIRFGGEDWKLGLVLFWGALYILFNAMVNRIRDARASAGWFIFPLMITVLAVVIAFNAGPTDLAGHVFRGTGLENSPVSLPARFLLAIPSVLFPFMVAIALSLFVWAFSLLMLAFLPSRPPRV